MIVRGILYTRYGVAPLTADPYTHATSKYICIYTVEMNGGEEFREKKRRREFTIRYTRATRSLRSGRNGLIESWLIVKLSPYTNTCRRSRSLELYGSLLTSRRFANSTLLYNFQRVSTIDSSSKRVLGVHCGLIYLSSQSNWPYWMLTRLCGWFPIRDACFATWNSVSQLALFSSKGVVKTDPRLIVNVAARKSYRSAIFQRSFVSRGCSRASRGAWRGKRMSRCWKNVGRRCAKCLVSEISTLMIQPIMRGYVANRLGSWVWFTTEERKERGRSYRWIGDSDRESEIGSRGERCASSNGTRVLSSLANALRRVFVHAWLTCELHERSYRIGRDSSRLNTRIVSMYTHARGN